MLVLYVEHNADNMDFQYSTGTPRRSMIGIYMRKYNIIQQIINNF